MIFKMTVVMNMQFWIKVLSMMRRHSPVHLTACSTQNLLISFSQLTGKLINFCNRNIVSTGIPPKTKTISQNHKILCKYSNNDLSSTCYCESHKVLVYCIES